MNEFLSLNPENKSGKIKLTDAVYQPVMDELIKQIGKIFGASAAASGEYTGELTNCAENAIDTLEIVIHSPGGSVLDGYTLYNEIMDLRKRGVHVTATINSLAASMASVIAMAADTIQIVPNGRMMIHDVQQGVRGNADALSKAAKICDDMSAEIATIYAEKSGQTVDDMRTLMKAETWLSAKQALEIGLVNALVDIQPTKPKPESMNLIERLKSPSNEESIERINALETQIAGHDSEIEDFKAKLELAEAALQEAAGFKAEIETLTAENAAKDADITALQTEVTCHEATIDTLTGEVAAAKESAGKIATETLASIGQPEPLEIEEVETKQTDLLSQYEALEGAEKRDFLNLHAVELRRLALEKSNL